MKVKPLSDRVLVIRDEKEEVSAGGIFIPDSAQKRPNRGTVIAVGPGQYGTDGVLRPLTVKEGDVVLFGDYSGSQIELHGKTCVFLNETEILAIVDSPKSVSA